MRVVYYADDGTEFETQEKCLEYENRNIKNKELLKTVHAFNAKFEKISSLDIEENLSSVYYVMFDSEDAGYAFDELQDYYGLPQIYRDIDDDIKRKEVYGYDDNTNRWYSVIERISGYNNILDIFKEYM